MSDRPLQAQQETVRIPLYNTESQSVGNNQSSLVKGWDQAYVNCWPVFRVNKQTGDTDTLIQKRPGNFSGDTSLPTSVTVGAGVFTLAAIQVAALSDVYVTAVMVSSEAKIYIIARNAAGTSLVNVGSFTYTVASNQPQVFLIETTVAAAPGIFLNFIDSTSTTTKSYYANTTAGAFTAASLSQVGVTPVDADYPTQLATPDPLVGAPVQMNGTMYVMGVSGKIYNSDLNSVTSWNALGVIQAISYPDRGVSLMRYKHHIVSFGEDSIEFFNDAGLPPPGSPLKRTDQAFIKFGARSAKAIASVKDTLYWISNSSSELLRIYKLDGYTPVLIDAEQYAAIYSRSSCFLSPVSFMGHTHLAISSETVLPNNTGSLPEMNTSYGLLMLDTETTVFWYWARSSTSVDIVFQTPTGIPPFISIQDNRASTTDAQYVIQNVIDYNTGTYYGWVFTRSNTTDQLQSPGDYFVNTVGTGYTVPIYSAWCTNPIEFGNYARKFIRRITVVTDLLYNSNVYLSFQKDGWYNQPQVTQTRTAYVSTAVEKVGFNNFGQARRLFLTVSLYSPAPILIRALELTVAQGTH